MGSDVEAAAQIAEGVFLILGSVATIPAGIAAGAIAIARAIGWFGGEKHTQKRIRRGTGSIYPEPVDSFDDEEKEDA